MAGLWGANQFALLTKEATYGTFDASATVKAWLEIQDDNGLTCQRDPMRMIKRAATGNLRRRLLSKRYKIEGSYKCSLHTDNALILLPLACTPATISGRTNLPSFTLDWFDGAEPVRTLGCRFSKVAVTTSNQSDWVEAAFSFIGSKEDAVAPTMTEPAITLYPTGAAYSFQDSAGQCKLYSGSSVTLVNYRSLSATITNILDQQYDEFPYLNSLDYCGRDVDAEMVIKKLDTTLKGYYQAQTLVHSLIKFAQTSPAAHSMIFDFGGSASISDLKTDRSLNKNEYQTLKIESFQDLTSGVDFVTTIA